MSHVKQQYDLIMQTREEFFRYCESLSEADYVKKLEGFGDWAIRDLHVHVADCYHSWLGTFALDYPREELQPEFIKNVNDTREAFKQVDKLVETFIHTLDGQLLEPITRWVRWQEEPASLTPLWLFTHTTTHEFHHKGQMVSMGRHLGYIPIDTDLVLQTEVKQGDA